MGRADDNDPSQGEGLVRWGEALMSAFGKSCTMIITEANNFVAEVRDRMPALLAEKDFEPWLGGEAGLKLLKPAAENILRRWPVSKRESADHPTNRSRKLSYCAFFTSGHLDSDNGWNAWSAGIVATSL